MSRTVNSHINPCFWTAHWNPEYLELALNGKRAESKARQKRVWELNVRSCNISNPTVENVHFVKNLGVATIKCAKSKPQQFMFEEILGDLEARFGYQVLLDVIRDRQIGSGKVAGIALFLAFQIFRCRAFLEATIGLGEQFKRNKPECLGELARMFGNKSKMTEFAAKLASGNWTLYRTRQDTFPLADAPILVRASSVMAALSPRLLLEIERTSCDDTPACEYSDEICSEKLEEFRVRTIANTFCSIIFSDKTVLEKWKDSPQFAKRREIMKSI
jgi:hypothetical protein